MAMNPGRSVGRVSIRVVPDTTRFRNELKNDLRIETAGLSATIDIDGARLDRAKVRSDIEQQMKTLRNIKVDVQATVTVDEARLSKTKIRASIQRQFDEMTDIRVRITAELRNAAEFERRVKEMAHRASNNKVSIQVGPDELSHRHTQAQLAYLSRTRVVTLVVRVAKTSVASAMTTLAALSGMRLTWDWMDSIKEFAQNLDKNLPAVLGWTSGISALTATLFASAAEIVAFGQAFVAMTPGLLVVPGIIMNAAGSLTALIVALKDANTELATLKPFMTELGTLISGEFWGRARTPIVDLVTNLMPQLRNAFTDLSAGMGDFTASLSNELAQDLGNGRLESIFKGIADGWRVLADGADGIAGALVSLSQIGAQYTPRLAAWFTRQANTFSSWLDRISNSGDLDKMMDGAITSMYDLWDATKGVSGVFAGLWKAADKAGAGGLRGFADLMETWTRNINTSGFQQGLSTLFAGAKDAMAALGDGIERFGGMLGGLAPEISGLMSSTATFVGGLIGGISDALNSPSVASGLQKFNSDLLVTLDRIEPSLQPIADVLGSLIGALGETAKTVLPTAVDAVAGLAPVLQGVIDAITPVLQPLSDSVGTIVQLLSPALSEFVAAVGPVFQGVVLGLAQALVDFVPAVAELLGGISDVIKWANETSANNKGFFDDVRLNFTPDADKWKTKLFNELGSHLKTENGFVLQIDTVLKEPQGVGLVADSIGRELESIVSAKGTSAGRQFVQNLAGMGFPTELQAELESRWGDGFKNALSSIGASSASGFGQGFTSGSTSLGPVLSGALNSAVASSSTALGPTAWGAGTSAVNSFGQGFKGSLLPLQTQLGQDMQAGLASSTAGASSWLLKAGQDTGAGFDQGTKATMDPAVAYFSTVGALITWKMINLRFTLYNIGQQAGQGLADGISSKTGAIASAAAYAASAAVSAAKARLDIHSPSRVARREIGAMWGRGVALGIRDEISTIRDANRDLIDPSDLAAPAALGGGATTATRAVNLHIHNPVVRDLQQEAWEAAQLVGEDI